MHCGPKELYPSRISARAYTAAAFLVVLSVVFWTGCGDIFRPVANPIPGPTADPNNFHIAVVVSQNAAGNPGSGMQIDVSGDSNVGVVNAGQQPVYAALLPQSSRVFVSNTDGTITSFLPAGFLGSIGTPTTISLPTGLVPGFLFSTEAGTMYAATSGTATPSPVCPNSAVLAISAISLAVENIMCVGLDPTVLTETPDGRKLYSVNSDGTVSSINTVDKTVNPPISCSGCTPALSNPVWAIASLDSAEVFVLDATGFVWVINTFTDQVILVTGQATGAVSNFMALESTHNRLYVTSFTTGGASTVSILDASNPTLPPVTAAPLPLPTSTTPVMAAFLPNGTRAYVLSATSTDSPELTIINTTNNTVFGTLNLPSATVNPGTSTCQSPLVRFPLSMAVAGNNSRVYVADCLAGSTSIIDTSTNTRLLTMNSPVSAYSPVAGAAFPPPQNPVFVVAGP